MSLTPDFSQCAPPDGVESEYLDGSGVTILTSFMLARAFGSWRRRQSLLAFIAAKRAVLSSLTGAGLMAAVLWVVNG